MTTLHNPHAIGADVRPGEADRLRAVVIMVALCALVLLSYISGLRNKPIIEELIRPQEFMTPLDDRQFRPAFAIPMLLLEATVGIQLDAPLAYRAFSLLAHLGAVLSLFFVARRLMASAAYGALAATLFALYPRHHEAVFSIGAASHLLMTLFALLCLLFYLRAREGSARSDRVLAVLLFALAVLASEAGAAVLGCLIGYEVLWHFDDPGPSLPRKLGSLLRRSLPYLAVVILYGASLVLGSNRAGRFIGHETDAGYYYLQLGGSTLTSLGGYVSYTLFPFVLLRSPDTLQKIVMLAASLGALGAGLACGARVVRLGLVWVLLTVLPFVLLVPYGNSDRYFYLPSVGFCLAAAGAAQMAGAWLAGPRLLTARRAAAVVGGALLIAYMAAGYASIQARALEWRAAGELVDGWLEQLTRDHPTVSADTRFYFLDLPQTYGQAKVASVGMRGALQGRYGLPTLRVRSGYGSDLIAAVERASPTLSPQLGVYVYQYRDGTLVDRSYSYGDPATRALIERYVTIP